MNKEVTENLIMNEDLERQLQEELGEKQAARKKRVYLSIVSLILLKNIVLIIVLIERSIYNRPQYLIFAGASVSSIILSLLVFAITFIVNLIKKSSGLSVSIWRLTIEMILSIVLYIIIVLTYFGYLSSVETIFAQENISSNSDI